MTTEQKNNLYFHLKKQFEILAEKLTNDISEIPDENERMALFHVLMREDSLEKLSNSFNVTKK